MADKVLMVDDDRNVLQGYHRILRGHFDLEVALGGPQALQAVARHGPFAVIVADMRMPGMNGLEVLQEVRRLSPDTVRIMLTGDLDQKTAADSVNQGEVFRFLTKPCEPEQLVQTIEAGLRQHRLIRAERDLLEGTLTGCVQVLCDLLATVSPASFHRAEEAKALVGPLATALGVEETWDLEVAALLAPIGRVTLPPALQAKLAANEALDPKEQRLLERAPLAGAELLAGIPRLEGIARMVRYQAKGFDGAGEPTDGVAGGELPLGARILKVLGDFVEVESGRRSRAVALEELRMHAGRYDPAVLQAFLAMMAEGRLPSRGGPPAPLDVGDLRPGMVLAEDLQTLGGRTVLPRGTRLNPAHLHLLANLAEMLDLPQPIPVESP